MERRQFDQSVVSAVSLMFGAAVLVYERNNKSGCLSRIFLTVLGGKKLSNFLGGEKKKSSDWKWYKKQRDSLDLQRESQVADQPNCHSTGQSLPTLRLLLCSARQRHWNVLPPINPHLQIKKKQLLFLPQKNKDSESLFLSKNRIRVNRDKDRDKGKCAESSKGKCKGR